MRDVRRSLGRPKATCPPAGGEARVLVTVLWDIVWYQYLVISAASHPGERVSLSARVWSWKNSRVFRGEERSVDVDAAGRLDWRYGSERPHGTHHRAAPVEVKALEDATEEIWDQHAAPGSMGRLTRGTGDTLIKLDQGRCSICTRLSETGTAFVLKPAYARPGPRLQK
jgi:hypothetical protein